MEHGRFMALLQMLWIAYTLAKRLMTVPEWHDIMSLQSGGAMTNTWNDVAKRSSGQIKMYKLSKMGGKKRAEVVVKLAQTPERRSRGQTAKKAERPSECDRLPRLCHHLHSSIHSLLPLLSTESVPRLKKLGVHSSVSTFPDSVIDGTASFTPSFPFTLRKKTLDWPPQRTALFREFRRDTLAKILRLQRAIASYSAVHAVKYMTEVYDHLQVANTAVFLLT
ncbi:unnamed protein product [Parajaminaea phylloscopi]